MTRQVFKTDIAENDLFEIWLYIAENSEDRADQLIHEIHSKANLFLTHPELGRSRPEVAEDTRSFPVGNYIIFYQDNSDGILILRVLHGARDLESLI